MRRIKAMIQSKRAIFEAGLIVLGALCAWAVSSKYDWLERFIRVSREYENLELDELLILCVYFTGALLVFSIRCLVETREREKKLADSYAEIRKNLDEEYLILREVNHRIKNNISSIESFLNIQRMGIEKEACGAILDEAIGRVHSMSCLYEKLIQSSSYTRLSLKEYLEDLIPSVMALYPYSEASSLQLSLDDLEADVQRVTAIGIIVNEVITNSMKYGARENRVDISVSLKNGKDGAVLVIRDEGNGFPAGEQGKDSLGITIIESLARQIHGTIRMRNAPGAETTLILGA